MALRLEKSLTYDQVAETIVEMGNHILAEDESADVMEVASGIMAGAVQLWLHSRQPCEDRFCQACDEINSPEHRLAALLEETRVLGEDSEYYSSINDVMTGTA
jgi:hypothetical protein